MTLPDGRVAFSRFVHETETVGRLEWHITDGTAPGTRLLASLPDVARGDPAVGAVATQTALGARVFFGIWDDDSSRQVWSLEPVTGDLTLLTTFNTTHPSIARDFRPVGQRVLFSGSDGAWVSDGTTGGTTALLTDSGVYDLSFALLGAGTDGVERALLVRNSELFVTDGTVAGTTPVFSDAAPFDGHPSYLSGLGNGTAVFFTTSWPSRLWRTDGTETGTVAVAPVTFPSWDSGVPAKSTGGRVYFNSVGATSFEIELWASDGTVEGTQRVSERPTYAENPTTNLAAVDAGPDHRAYFANFRADVGYELFTSDGTAEGTDLVADLNTYTYDADLSPLREAGDLRVFAAARQSGGILWRTDGTTAGTFTIVPSPDPNTDGVLQEVGHDLHGATIGNELVFWGRSREASWEPWVTDGTAAGTRRVSASFNSFLTGTSVGRSFYDAGELAYFAVADASGRTMLARTDGTEAGTFRLEYLTSISYVATFGGKTYFNATDIDNVRRLWVTDGTVANTREIGYEIRNQWGYRARPLVRAFDAEVAYFVNSSGVHSFDASGVAQLVVPRDALGETAPREVVVSAAWGGGFLLAVSPTAYVADEELWWVDSDGTMRAVTTGLHVASGATVIEGPTGPVALWTSPGFLNRSDGTASGTYRLAYGATGIVEVARSRAYIQGWLGSDDVLLETDGTREGTGVLYTPHVGIPGGSIDYLARQGNGPPSAVPIDSPMGLRVLFHGVDRRHGEELWYLEPEHPRLFADAGVSAVGLESQPVQLQGMATVPPGREIVAWEWDLHTTWQDNPRDGFDVDAIGQNVEITRPDDETSAVFLRITDDTGAQHVSQAYLSIENVPPTLQVVPDDSEIAPSEELTLSLSATDPGDDSVGNWLIKWGDGSQETVYGNETTATHAYAAEGTYSIEVRAADDDGYWNAVPVTIKVQDAAPVVLARSFEVDFRPSSLVWSFSKDVAASLAVDDLQLQRVEDGAVVPVSHLALAYDATSNTATFTFPGYTHGILPDGNYTATLPAGSVEDLAGNPLAEDFVLDFFVLAGDADRDRDVDFFDFLKLRANYGQTDKLFSDGDFDYDGDVDFFDFLILRGNYGLTLPPPEGSGSLFDDGEGSGGL